MFLFWSHDCFGRSSLAKGSDVIQNGGDVPLCTGRSSLNVTKSLSMHFSVYMHVMSPSSGRWCTIQALWAFMVHHLPDSGDITACTPRNALTIGKVTVRHDGLVRYLHYVVHNQQKNDINLSHPHFWKKDSHWSTSSINWYWTKTVKRKVSWPISIN